MAQSEKEWHKKTQLLLRRYRYLPAEISSLQDKLDFYIASGPSITPAYTERVSSNHDVSKPQEKYLAKVAELEEEIRQRQHVYRAITRSLEDALTDDERKLCKWRYLQNLPTDVIWGELGIEETSYRKMHDLVILKLAISIDEPLVIVPDEDRPEEFKGLLLGAIKNWVYVGDTEK